MIEAPFYICIVDKLWFVYNGLIDHFDRIMARASWSKSVAIWLKLGLPFWFESHLSQCLLASFEHRRNTKRTFFVFPWFGYPDSPYWFGFALFPVLQMYLFCHDKALPRRNGSHSIHSCRFLALVILCHPSYCEEPRRL